MTREILDRVTLFVALVVFCGLAIATWPFTIDDAYIIAKYAENLAAGDGYALNPNEPSDGITGPLYVVPAVVGALFGDPVFAQKVFGALCVIASSLMVLVVLRGAQRIIAALVLALSPMLWLWSGAGLETGLACLVLTGSTFAAIGDKPRRFAGLAPLMFFLRPETTLAVLAGASAWFFPRDEEDNAEGRGPRWRTLASVVAAWVAGGVLVAAFRAVLFSDVLPLSYYAKPAVRADGVRYVFDGVVACTGGAGLLVALAAARLGVKERVVALVIVTELAAVAYAGGCWMVGFRLLVPILPLYAFAVARSVGDGVSRGGGARVVAIVALVLSVAWPAVWSSIVYAPLPRVAEVRESRGHAIAQELHGTVAVVDIGFFALYRDLTIVDLGGVTDPVVAHAPGVHIEKEVPEVYLRERGVEQILLHASEPPVIEDGRLVEYHGFKVEERVAALPWVRANFRATQTFEYEPGYSFVLLERTSL